MQNILVEAGLTPQEIIVTKACVMNQEAAVADFYDTTAFEKLYEYFTFTTAEMPYGIAKARTGDPDVWILERLHQEHLVQKDLDLCNH